MDLKLSYYLRGVKAAAAEFKPVTPPAMKAAPTSGQRVEKQPGVEPTLPGAAARQATPSTNLWPDTAAQNSMSAIQGKYALETLNDPVLAKTVKDQAILLALQKGMALHRRGTEIHALKSDGTSQLISTSPHHGVMWNDAHEALKLL